MASSDEGVRGKAGTWIRWDGGSLLTCERCEKSYGMALPAPIDIVAAIIRAWFDLHINCQSMDHERHG